jgi:MFS family permease
VLVDVAVSALFVWDVFTPWLAREIGASRASLAAVFAVGVALYTVGVLAGGWAADRWSSRVLVRVGAVGALVGLAWCGYAESIWALAVAFSVVLGMTTGAGYAVAVRVAVTASRRRGLALTVVVSAYAAATVVLAPLAHAALEAYGRRWTFVALGVLLSAALTVASFLVPGSPPSSESASSGGLPRRVVVRWWLVFCLASAPALVGFAHAGSLGGSAALAVALLSFGNLFGRLVSGPLLDRIGPPLTLRLSCVLLAVCALALPFGGVLAYVALFGLGTQYGSLSAIVPAGVADRVPAASFGFAYGLVFTGWGFGGLVAPIAAAWVGLTPTFLACIPIAAAVWLLAGAKGPPRTR